MQSESKVQEDLLSVARSRCDVDEIAKSHALLAWILGRTPDPAERVQDLAIHIRQRIVEVVESEKFPSHLREAALLMIGADSRTQGRVSRTQIKELMAQTLVRRRSAADLERTFTTRSVEITERNEIVPEIYALLSTLRELGVDRYKIDQTVQSLDRDEESYVLRTRVTFSANTASLVLAVTADETAADWVCSEMPGVLDVYSPREGGFTRFSASQKMGNTWQRMPDFERDLQLEGQFHRLYPNEATCEFWRTNAVQHTVEYIQYRLVCEFELNFLSQYFYWVAPHRLFLESLNIDLDKFKEHVKSIEVYPRLGNRPSLEVDQENLLGQVVLNRWVDRAASVEVRWVLS